MVINISILLLIITLCLNVFLGLYVLTRNTHNKLYQSFFLLTICFAFWNMQAISMRAIKDYYIALYAIKFFATGIKFIPCTFFYFVCLEINNKKKHDKFILYISFVIAGIFAVLTWVDGLIIKDIKFLSDGAYFIEKGNKVLTIFLGLYYISFPAYANYLIYYKYKNSISIMERRRYYSINIGMFIAIIGGIIDIIFVIRGQGIYPIGQFFTILFSLSLAISVLKYHLMDMEFTIKKTFVYSIVFSAITGLFVIVVMILEYYVRMSIGVSSFFVTASAIGVFTLVSQPLREKIYRVVDHIFFKEKYDMEDTISDFAQGLTTKLNRDEVLDLITHTINKVLHIEKVNVMLRNKITKSEEFYTMSAMSTTGKDKDSYCFKQDNPILQYFQENNTQNKPDMLIRYILEDEENASKKQEILEELNKMGSMVILPISLKDKCLGFLNLGKKLSGEIYYSHDIKLLQTICNEFAVALENAMLYTDLKESFFSTVRSLAMAIEAKDAYTRGHCDRVANYAIDIARKMDLAEETIDHIKIGGLLHDVGKIGIRDEILLKKGRLTDMEFDIISKHPEIGVSILTPGKFPEEIVDIIKYHHERLNGSGYPEHLYGDEIPLTAKIVSIADVFEALTSDRSYRNALPYNEAVGILEKGRGQLFDTTIIEIFLNILEEKRRLQIEMAS